MRILAVIVIVLTLLAGCQTTDPRLSTYENGKINFQHQNYGVAFKQLLPAAYHGQAQAQYAIGYMYYYGLGTTKDKNAAIQWMRKAAHNHNLAAKQALALIDTPLWGSHQAHHRHHK